MITLRKYIERYFKINTKDNGLVPLKLNSAQDKFYQIFKEKYNANQPLKVIVLKARQLGISTVTEAIMSALTMTHFDKRGLIVAHNPDSTAAIFRMTQTYYDNLPPKLQPMTKYSNRNELSFENPTKDRNEKARNPGLRSSIKVALAGSSGVGRASTYNYMHLSELAFWEEHEGLSVKDQLLGLLQTLPNTGFSFLVIESTANGFNYFKELWDKATAGENEYIPLFIPWFEMAEYRRPYNNEQLTQEEQQIRKQFNLDNEQLMWRRYAIATLCGGDTDKFKQEYPSTPDEAFLLTGSPVFDAEIVVNRLNNIRPPVKTGYFVGRTFVPAERGTVRIWSDPVPGRTYAIGADTAGEGSDYFVAYVIEKETLEMCAAYRCQTDEDLFAVQIEALGYMYNTALIGVETNYGTYAIITLQKDGYPRLYVREVMDTYLNRYNKAFGFKTTSVTRPLIIAAAVEFVREHADKIHDPILLKEMLTFVKDKNGKPQATSGSHDDCVMAFCISLNILPQAGGYQAQPIDEEPDSYDSFINFGA